MPELPEVESICISLKKLILHEEIIEAKILTEYSLRKEIPREIANEIIGCKIIKIERRAKYILIFLSNVKILIIHLGMSGKLLIKDSSYDFQKHDHYVFILKSGKQVVYNDPRRFGLLVFTEANNIMNLDIFKNLGVEPLSVDFTRAKLKELMFKVKKPIKLAIMDNKKIVGIGNIYASESLFLSKISPLRMANSLSNSEINLLHNNIIEVLKNSIKHGGSTLKDFKHVNGESGYFQNNFFVYGRENNNCKKCSNLIAKINQGGRSSFYCSNCQK